MRPRKRHNIFPSASRLACLLFALSAAVVYSQTVTFQLSNGDRISGVVVTEDLHQVIVSNTWAKEIVIPLAEIKSREPIAPTPAATNGTAVAKSPAPKPAVPKPVAPPKPTPVVKAKPKDWHGDIAVGADIGISERDRELYYGKFRITYAPVGEGTPSGASKFIGRFRNTFDYNAAYGITETGPSTNLQRTVSANRMDGSSKTDFDLGSERNIFVYNLMGAGYDEIRKIEYRYELGPGVGYHLLKRTNLVLNAEVGMNYQAQHFTNGSSNERFYYRFAEDFSWKISKKFTFDEKFEFFPQVDFEEYRFRFECNLRYWLWEYLSFNLSVLDIYDTQPARNVGRNDLQIRSSIGVKF